MKSNTTTQTLLRLSPLDNIAVATANIGPGDESEIDGIGLLRACSTIAFGHKIAIAPIPAGEKVIKLGRPIGSATCDIAPGQHVHTHNLKSDYIPTFTLETPHAQR